MIEITPKVQLINMLTVSHQRVVDWFTAVPVEDFFIRYGETWSASDNLDHLIRSHQPLVQALKLPRLALRALFGKPGKPSMGYEELCQAYRDQIARGARASGRYLPRPEGPNLHVEARKRGLLKQFSNASTQLISAVEAWQDEDLDHYLLPHPLLDKLTVREMLFFTVYHNLRHASREGD